MWCNILFLIVIDLLIIQTNAVNMCTDGSALGKDVTLNLLNGTGVNGCNCSLKLHNIDTIRSIKPQITFEVVNFTGCKYSLVISYNNTILRFSCNNYDPFVHDINKTDEIKLYLESTSSQDDTTFEVKITSSATAIGGPMLRLECLSPDTARTTAETEATTSVSSTTVSQNYKPTVGASKQSDEDLGIGIHVIGGAVGGGLLLVIVIIITVVCIIWRKKKTERRDYDRPAARELGPGYTEVDIVRQGKDNNSSQEMEIIENDLYISSGEVMQSISQDDEDTHQKPDTEYAVVKKDRKPTNTTLKDVGHSNSSIEPNIDRKFVIGPQGDEYTLVERN